MAARAEPMPKVTEMVRFTLMPISSAAPRSSLTQRMALPIFVLAVNRVRATMITMLAQMVMMVALETLRPPSRRMELLMNVRGKDLGFAPHTISAIFCNR